MEVVEQSAARLHLSLPVSRWSVVFSLFCLLWSAPAWYWWLGWTAFIVVLSACALVAMDLIPERYDVIADRATQTVAVKHSGRPFGAARKVTDAIPFTDIADIAVERTPSRLSAIRFSYRMRIVKKDGIAIPVNNEATKTDLADSARLLGDFIGIARDDDDSDDGGGDDKKRD